MSIPLKLTGKEFEAAIVEAAKRLPGVHVERYGTRTATVPDDEKTEMAKTSNNPKIRGKTFYRELSVPSLPDFDFAVAPEGRQRIIEAKVCGDTAFKMVQNVIKWKQVDHMLSRAAVGVPCWLLIHWTVRDSQATGQTLHPARTVALPVGDQFHPRWRQFVNAELVAKKIKKPPQAQPAITREESFRQGRIVDWIIPPRCRKPVLDLGPLLGLPSAQEVPAVDEFTLF